jgi:hypothetical protein
MEISVDGSPRNTHVIPATIGTLIADLKNDLLDDGRVILSLTLDGRTVDGEYEKEVAGMSPGVFGRFSVETADQKTLCLATLDEVAHHIQPIIDESARIAELIDTGNEAQAFGRIGPCVEVWGAIVKAVHNIAQLMQVDMMSVAACDETLSSALKGLVELLQSIKNHVDARDLVALRDVMKHQMPEVAKRIAAQLDALSNQVAAK